MRNILSLSLAVLVMSGCADRYLDKREGAVLRLGKVSETSALLDQALFARRLSGAYLAAGQDTARSQDIASAVIILSAASVAVGALGSASDAALQNRALLGIGTQTVASRGVPQAAINALYNGAKRANCVATVSRIGIELLADQSDATKRAARAATYGVIVEVQLITREGLVREVADYSSLLDDFSGALNIERRATPESGIPPEEEDAINKYLKLLSKCVAGTKGGSLEGAEVKK